MSAELYGTAVMYAGGVRCQHGVVGHWQQNYLVQNHLSQQRLGQQRQQQWLVQERLQHDRARGYGGYGYGGGGWAPGLWWDHEAVMAAMDYRIQQRAAERAQWRAAHYLPIRIADHSWHPAEPVPKDLPVAEGAVWLVDAAGRVMTLHVDGSYYLPSEPVDIDKPDLTDGFWPKTQAWLTILKDTTVVLAEGAYLGYGAMVMPDGQPVAVVRWVGRIKSFSWPNGVYCRRERWMTTFVETVNLFGWDGPSAEQGEAMAFAHNQWGLPVSLPTEKSAFR